MPREVLLKLKSLLDEADSETPKDELATMLGVSEATLRSYIENRWTVLDRIVLERLADFFQRDAGEFLVTRESGFFDPFRSLAGVGPYAAHPTCVFVRRPDAHQQETGRVLAYRDHLAIGHVDPFLRQSVEGLVATEAVAETPAQFEECLLQNCIVVGSPVVNPAAEMAICRAFNVSDATEPPRLPLAFRVRGKSVSGHTTESVAAGKMGLWLRQEEELVEVDYWPPKEFEKMRIGRGRDCAVIVVLNHEPSVPGSALRKLVILSGFSGVGTEAAALALVDHYRNLEPQEDERLVWGIIEATYKKPAKSTRRELVNYSWRCRIGGRCPVAFTTRKR